MLTQIIFIFFIILSSMHAKQKHIVEHIETLILNENLKDLRCFLWLNKETKEAMYYIGMLYIQGMWKNSEFVEDNKKIGNNFLLQSAKLNYPRAMCALADSYYSGDGIQKDLKKAIFWYKKAAQHNYPPSFFHLGEIYLKGVVVKKSKKKAKFYFEKAFDFLPHLREFIIKKLLLLS